MNIFLEVISLDNIVQRSNYFEYVVGLEGISLRAPATFSFDEIDQIIGKAESVGHGVALNASKIFHEDELDHLRATLMAIKERNIKHIFFSDLAVYMIARELGMNDRLVYNATTYLANSEDVNHYLDLGTSVVISPDLSLREQIEIVNHTKKPSVIFAFGKYAIFHSRRELLTNYFEYRNFDNINLRNNRNLTIVEELRFEHHPIVEDENGTHVFTSKYYCLLKEINLFNKPFNLYLSTNFLTNDQINFLAQTYDDAATNNKKAESFYDELQQVIPGLGEGIRNQKTFLLKKDGGAE